MGDHIIHRNRSDEAKAEEAEAQVEIWKYVFGFSEMAAVKCAIELGIADVLESQENQTMSLHALSSSLGCSPSSLYRIMRFLTSRRIFKQCHHDDADPRSTACCYAQTPLSRLLRKRTGGEKSMASFVLFETSPVMLGPWQLLKARVLDDGVGLAGAAPFDVAHGKDLWEYGKDNPGHGALLNEAMSCDTRIVVPTILENCPEVFDGIGTLVDVGGGDGTALRTLIRARPGIRGINFDLPHVASSVAPAGFQGIENVGGDFFRCVPKADAAFIKWVLHDWGDDECIQILKNCREAVPPNTGKVIILEAVIDDDEEEEEEEDDEEKKKMLKDYGLMLDMIMMAHTTTGKERTAKEWAYVLVKAGFSRHTVKWIPAVQSVIEAYP